MACNHPTDTHLRVHTTTMKPKTPYAQIVLRTTHARKGAYVRASREANTTLANWIFHACDSKAQFSDKQPTIANRP